MGEGFKILVKLAIDKASAAGELKSALKELENQAKIDVKFNTGSAKSDIAQTTASVTKMASELSRLSKVQSMERWAANNSKAMKKFGKEINNIIGKMGSLDKKISRREQDDLSTQFKKIQTEAIATGNVGKTAFDKLKTAWEKFGGWSLATGALMKLKTEFVDGVKFVIDLDDAMTDVAYTSNISKAQLKSLGISSVDMAKDLSTSASNVLEAVKIYSTANSTAEDILRKSKPAIMLSNVSGMSGTESSKTIQTALNQFGLDDSAEGLLDITDTLQYVSSQLNYDFTEGIKQITEGVEASGSVAKNAGLSFQEFATMVGLAVEKTGQSGSTIGNAYKTIFSRITKASEIEGTMTSDISNAEKALRGIGVEVRNSNNDFRDMSDIMADIGEVWNDLSDTQKSKVGYEVAGIRQLNVLNSLFGAWDEYAAIMNNSDDRAGMSLKNQEVYADSLKGKLGELSATAQSFWQSFIGSGAVGGTIETFTSLLSVLDSVTSKIGSLGTIGLATGLFAGLKNVGTV